MVCEESNAFPIDGSATLATERFRLATAATMISDASTSAAARGAWLTLGALERVGPRHADLRCVGQTLRSLL